VTEISIELKREPEDEVDQVAQFFVQGYPKVVRQLSLGHLHATYLLELSSGPLIVQKLNNRVFTDLDALLENARLIQECFADSVIKIPRSISGAKGELLFSADGSGYWRCFEYVSGSVCYEVAQSPEMVLSAGRLLGGFLRQLNTLAIGELAPVLPDFQNSAKRFVALKEAYQGNPLGRAELARPLFEQLLEIELSADIFNPNARLSVWNVHNDMKLSNVLFDVTTGEAGWVLDLDTCMAGYWLYDFGDFIRNVVVRCSEDESDLQAIEIDQELLTGAVRGFLEGVASAKLSERDLMVLPKAPAALAYCLSTRFLADFLLGDHYFSTKHNQHNLQRAMTQYKIGQLLDECGNLIQQLVLEHLK
jgi:Ser/Thr protein kinase RdoA (MazF antagonist)